MNLLVDIGNTTIGVVFQKGQGPKTKFVLTCDKSKSIDEYIHLFENIFGNLKNAPVEHIVISSVVPIVLQIVSAAFRRMYPNASFINVKPGVKTGVLFKIDNINELGADLVSDTVGMKKKYKKDAICVDIGTATKFLYLNSKGEFEGCSISPGLVSSVKGLCNATSLLPEIDIAFPKSIIGKNTNESLKSGAILGHALMISAMCDEYEKEAGVKLTRIVTGGYAHILNDYFKEAGFIYDEDLIYDGLDEILNRNLR